MRLNIFKNQEEYWRGVCAAEIKSLYEDNNLMLDVRAAYIKAENKIRYKK